MIGTMSEWAMAISYWAVVVGFFMGLRFWLNRSWR